MITIVLADSHSVIRQELKALLEADPSLAVTGEAGDGVETIQVVQSLRPEVLVLDLMIDGTNGLEIASQIRRYSPRTGVVIVSVYEDEAYALEALRSGAKAYILKECNSDELVRAIHEVCAGRCYLSPPLSQRSLDAYVRKIEGTTFDVEAER